jgi:hypothetical protein
MNRTDVSYDGIPSGAAINFNPSFGKISMGEYFKVLFTIQNTSANYNLEELKLKSTVVRVLKNPNPNQPAPKEQILTELTIPQLGPKEQIGFIFAFRVDHEDQYQMQIDMNYTSQYFTEQLNKFYGNNEDIDPYQLSSANAQIDFFRKKVTRYQIKKYKFEAMLPFEVSKHITLRGNRYIL